MDLGKGPIDEQAARESIREFLGALTPGELRRVVDLFRMGVHRLKVEQEDAVNLTPGLQKPSPGCPGADFLRSFAAKVGN